MKRHSRMAGVLIVILCMCALIVGLFAAEYVLSVLESP